MADSKLTALTALTSASTDDLLYIVDDPGGTPASKKITFDNVQGSLTKVGKTSVTQPATSSTLAVADGKTLTASNTLTLAGTDSTTITFQGTDTYVGRTTTDTLTNKTLTAPTVGGAAVLSAAATVSLTVPSADATATGPCTSSFNSGFSSTAVGDLLILDSSATWQKADANTASLYNGMLGIALSVAASAAAVKVALPGSFVEVDTWNWTVGSPIYMSETAGAMTQTAPTTTDSATRVVGYAVHADKIFFFPSGVDYVTHT